MNALRIGLDLQPCHQYQWQLPNIGKNCSCHYKQTNQHLPTEEKGNIYALIIKNLYMDILFLNDLNWILVDVEHHIRSRMCIVIVLIWSKSMIINLSWDTSDLKLRLEIYLLFYFPENEHSRESNSLAKSSLNCRED
jgi:hypothetical protein